MASLKYWVWLSAMTELRPLTRSKLVSSLGDPEKVYFADEKLLMENCALTDFERGLLADKDLARAEKIIELCRGDGTDIMTLEDSAYPKRLAAIFDPPVVLYIRGKLPEIDEEAAIGVVGTRRATPYGIKMGRSLGYEIARSGGIVVTGLAAGVDSAAARGALLAGGRCVGVIGCAIDDVYPKYNTEMYEDVEHSGALVSEYPPGTPTQGRNFPERNRIISGLSVGVTVIEAPKGSGALITAHLALDQGREVFAVPGNADQINCRGSNGLIKEGALLVTGGWDVCGEFAERFPSKLAPPDLSWRPDFDSMPPEKTEAAAGMPEKRPPETGRGFVKVRARQDRKTVDNKKPREYIDLKEQLAGLNETQLRIIGVMGEKAVHVDDIIDSAGLPASVVLSELTVLQIKGFVVQESGKRFSLNIQNYK